MGKAEAPGALRGRGELVPISTHPPSSLNPASQVFYGAGENGQGAAQPKGSGEPAEE